MSERSDTPAERRVAADVLARTVREEAGVVLAALVATLGDLDLAEEAFQEATVAALDSWARDGLPRTPAAWLTAVARRKALDRLRHDRMRAGKEAAIDLEERLRRAESEESRSDTNAALPDERLRLIFTCCHPALAEEVRVALTLRTLGGLSVAEVASAFLVSEATMAKRLVRAKKKIREARIPYRVPDAQDLPQRLASVLAVLYLIFNQGWSLAERASTSELCTDAIRLTRVLASLLPAEPEVGGLLALMRLHHARRDARLVNGEWVALEAQEGSRWDWPEISEGLATLRAALAHGVLGPFQLQACISALHASSALGEARWREIAILYERLERIAPSPVVSLNRSVALARVEGPEAGLRLLDALAARAGDRLADYQPYHAARADLLRRAGRAADAADAYRRALALTQGDAEQRHLAARLAELARVS